MQLSMKTILSSIARIPFTCKKGLGEIKSSVSAQDRSVFDSEMDIIWQS